MKAKNKKTEINAISMVAIVFLLIVVISVKLELWKEILYKKLSLYLNCAEKWGYVKYEK